MRTLKLLLAITILATSLNSTAQAITKSQKKEEQKFIKYADEALQVMKLKALEMKINGAALVYYIPGDETKSWISKMVVVGAMSNDGWNFLAIANSKAAEMAETYKNSGSKERKVKMGEFGYIGGAIKKIGSGYILATFSGASGEQDFVVSTTGLDWLGAKF